MTDPSITAGKLRSARSVTEPFAIKLPSLVEVGGGVSERLPEHLQVLGARRVLVVTDAFLNEHGPVSAIVARLEEAGIATAVFHEVQPDPTTINVRDGLEALHRHGAEAVVAVGGGSPIDAAKAVAVMAGRDGSIADYAGYDRIGGKALPLVAIPTTAGSGSEQTRATVIADTERNVKLAIYDDALLPVVALVDYRLSLTQPRELTAHVGIDALVHAVEAYVSRRATPVSDALAVEAARMVWSNLRTAFGTPDAEPARAAVMLGASLAGAAFSNSSVCLVHGMSRPIGANFHIAHGLANALLFSTVTRFGLESSGGRYAELARAIGLADETAGDDEANAALIESLDSLVAALEIPTMPDLGVSETDYEAALAEMADAALASGSPAFNPRQPTKQEIIELYREAY